MRSLIAAELLKLRSTRSAWIPLAAEFNITIDLDVLQQASRIGEKDKRVGKCDATFHVTPKVHHKKKAARKRK